MNQSFQSPEPELLQTENQVEYLGNLLSFFHFADQHQKLGHTILTPDGLDCRQVVRSLGQLRQSVLRKQISAAALEEQVAPIRFYYSELSRLNPGL